MTNTPLIIDTQLASLLEEHYRLQTKRDSLEHTALRHAGAKFYYRGRRQVTDMSVEEAFVTVEALLEEHKDDESGYTRVGTSNIGQVRSNVHKHGEVCTALAANRKATKKLDEQYTRWSRFFLVTSSPGHIHSSMHCSTCRPTTTYAWIPTLSGKTQADAIDMCGPALCTVCFPDAPTEATSAKITAARAKALAESSKEGAVADSAAPNDSEAATPRKENTMAAKADTTPQFVKVEGVENTGKKFGQVASMIKALQDAGAPIPFAQLCEDAGVKYAQDVEAALFALELNGTVDRYSFVKEGSTRRQVAYAIATEARPTPAASTGSKRRSSKPASPKASA